MLIKTYIAYNITFSVCLDECRATRLVDDVQSINTRISVSSDENDDVSALPDV